jgi:phosphoglycerate dehydrogenase-like enzyme
MNTWQIGCPDAWAPEIRTQIEAAVPEGFKIVFADAGANGSVREVVAESDFLLLATTEMTSALVDSATHLRLIHKWGIGVDSIDLAAAERAGIGVAITAGANAHAVAEHTILLILATLRRLSLVDRALREGRWLFKEMRAQCLQLSGKTVGLIGLGNIGRAVARRLQGFDVKVIYYDPRRAPAEVEAALHAELVPFDTVLERADIISLHCPGGEASRHLLGSAQFARIKHGAVLINAARGELLDEAALFEALTMGRLMGAGLDVFDPEPPAADNPLLTLENITLSPHTAASVLDNVERVARQAFGNMQRVVRGEPLPEPDLILPPTRRVGATSTDG